MFIFSVILRDEGWYDYFHSLWLLDGMELLGYDESKKEFVKGIDRYVLSAVALIHRVDTMKVMNFIRILSIIVYVYTALLPVHAFAMHGSTHDMSDTQHQVVDQ